MPCQYPTVASPVLPRTEIWKKCAIHATAVTLTSATSTPQHTPPRAPHRCASPRPLRKTCYAQGRSTHLTHASKAFLIGISAATRPQIQIRCRRIQAQFSWPLKHLECEGLPKLSLQSEQSPLNSGKFPCTKLHSHGWAPRAGTSQVSGEG